MNALTLEHDQLQQNVTGNTYDQQHPLIVRVNRWESSCIEKIKEVANDVRFRLRNSLNQMKRYIQESLPEITRELEESRQAETYTEIELNKWMGQLNELREQVDKLPLVKLSDDEEEVSSTHIPLIQLRKLRRVKGKDRCFGGKCNGEGDLPYLLRPFIHHCELQMFESINTQKLVAKMSENNYSRKQKVVLVRSCLFQ